MNPVLQFEIGSMKNFIYLLLDQSSQQAAIIDPQKDLSKPLLALKEQGFTLSTIILTHTHHDHVAGVEPLLKLYPNLEVRVGARDLHRLSDAVTGAPGLKVIAKDQKFKLGSLEIEAILTPGHSAGAVTYYIPAQNGVSTPCVFTGDTLFIRDCGRTDFDSGSNEEMFNSIQRMKTLPLETTFWVGHHYAAESVTTLQKELEESPPFTVKTVAELAALP